MSSLLFLQWLGCVLLMVSDALSQGPGVLCFPWEILLCVAVVVFIITNRYALRRKREQARCHSEQSEVHGKVCRKTGLTVQTSEEALKTPVTVASVPRLQTLCLAALNNHLNTPSLDTEGFLKTVKESVPPRPSCHRLAMAHLQPRMWSLAGTLESHQSQVTDAKQILKTPTHIQHLQKKLMDVLNENIHLQQNLELLFRESEGRKRTQELMEMRESLECSHAQVQQELTENENHLKSLGETMLKAIQVPQLLKKGPIEAGPLAAEIKREMGSGHHPVSPSEVDLRGLVFATNLKVYEKDKEILCRRLCEENQVNYMLMGQRDHLQRERASLRCQNSQLKSKNRELRLKLGVLTELHGQRVKQLLRKSAEEQGHHLEIEERLCKVYENLNNIQQRCSFYQKMVKDMEEELERTTVSCQNKILFSEERVRESWMANLSAKRQVNALRKENNYIRQKLAHLQVKSKSIQRGHFAHRGPEVPGIPSHQVPSKEESYVGRSQGSKVPCKFN